MIFHPYNYLFLNYSWVYDPIDVNELFIPIHDLRKYVKVHPFQDINNLQLEDI